MHSTAFAPTNPISSRIQCARRANTIKTPHRELRTVAVITAAHTAYTHQPRVVHTLRAASSLLSLRVSVLGTPIHATLRARADPRHFRLFIANRNKPGNCGQRLLKGAITKTRESAAGNMLTRQVRPIFHMHHPRRKLCLPHQRHPYTRTATPPRKTPAKPQFRRRNLLLVTSILVAGFC